MSYLEMALKLIKEPPVQERGPVDQGVPKNQPLIVDSREYELNEIDEKSPPGLNCQPSPIGYGGFDLEEVARAERWNDKMSIVDPIYRKLNCYMWLASHYIYQDDMAKAHQARDLYHQLRHSDETITEQCGLCETGDSVFYAADDEKKS